MNKTFLEILLGVLGMRQQPADVVQAKLDQLIAAAPDAAPILRPIADALRQAITDENRDSLAAALKIEAANVLALKFDPRDHPSDA